MKNRKNHGRIELTRLSDGSLDAASQILGYLNPGLPGMPRLPRPCSSCHTSAMQRSTSFTVGCDCQRRRAPCPIRPA